MVILPDNMITRATDLDSVDLFLSPIPLMHQTNDGSGALADCAAVADAVLLQKTGSAFGHRLSTPVRF